MGTEKETGNCCSGCDAEVKERLVYEGSVSGALGVQGHCAVSPQKRGWESHVETAVPVGFGKSYLFSKEKLSTFKSLEGTQKTTQNMELKNNVVSDCSLTNDIDKKETLGGSWREASFQRGLYEN